MSLTRIFGPAAAGVLAGVAVFGIGGAYLVAAVFSVVSTLLTMRLPKLEPQAATRGHPVTEILDGGSLREERKAIEVAHRDDHLSDHDWIQLRSVPTGPG